MEGPEVDPYLEETKILLAMSEEDRTEYVKSVMGWFTGGLGYIVDSKGQIQMNKRFKKVGNQWSDRVEELMTCALWSVKREFRSEWMELLGTLVGMHRKR